MPFLIKKKRFDFDYVINKMLYSCRFNTKFIELIEYYIHVDSIPNLLNSLNKKISCTPETLIT
jgi:hypothetical protein